MTVESDTIEKFLASVDAAIARLDSDDGSEIQFNDVMTVVLYAKHIRAAHNHLWVDAIAGEL